MKLKEKLDRIRKSTPNRSAFGQLYKTEGETRQKFKRITLYVLFISDEATHLLRNHVFATESPRTPRQWHAWFGELVNENDGSDTEPLTEQRLTHIHRVAVLPGISVRTSKNWSVRKIIGWVGGGARKDALSRSNNSTMVKRRNKAKSKGKTRR